MRDPDRDTLLRLAARQAGHFTLAQAAECGFTGAQIRAHQKTGTFARVHPSVYRFVRYPAPSYGKVMAAWLAARGDGVVVSHETALWLHGLSARSGREVHLTLGTQSDRGQQTPLRSVILHVARRRWRPDEVVRWEGMAVTAPARTIVDAAEGGAGSQAIERAVHAALGSGLATRKTLADAARGRSKKVGALLGRAVRTAPPASARSLEA
ncbi:MAG TPA: type IV toxin-antitoxin system AbiEi family antitoxin domain-containing protein [bacterium]|jgi:predicted transcriptional regulator of viral defense system|nr:type IV toxin-antitoxin system AbiEi family antitoxin domain-containing protein [bacterium]